MTTTAREPLNAETLYPLLLRAQELGAPLKVNEQDRDGDAYITVKEGAGEDTDIDSFWLYRNADLYPRNQYVVMGALMDWLGLLAHEVGCSGCFDAQRAMARAWAEGGFAAMLGAFNENVEKQGINECAEALAKMRAGPAEEDERAEIDLALAALRERVSQLEAELEGVSEREGRYKRQRDEARNKLQKVYELVSNVPFFSLNETIEQFATTVRGPRRS